MRVRLLPLSLLLLGAPGLVLAQADEIDQALATEITVSFANTPLEDAVEAVRSAARLNVVIDPSVPAGLAVTAESSNGKAGKVLDQLLAQHKLKRTRWCGALLIHGAETKPGPEPEVGQDVAELRAKTSVSFAATPLSEALERLKGRSKLEFFLPSRVRARIKTESVTLKLWSIETRHAITHLARAAGMTWSWVDGKVELALAGAAREVDANQLRDVDLREGPGVEQKEDVGALIAQLGEPGSRQGAARRLVAVGAPAAGPVAASLAKADGPTAAAALSVLAKIGKGHESTIQAIFSDATRSLEVRTAAGQALGALKAESAIPTLIEALADPWFKISETARAALIAIGPPAIGPLQARFEQEQKKTKGAKEGLIYRALLVFGSIPDDRARAVLLEVLETRGTNDRAVALRHHAAIGLGFTGDPKMVEPLIDALGSEQVFIVAKYIARSLNWITDAELPPQHEAWRTWWGRNKDKFIGRTREKEVDDLAKPLEPDFGNLPPLEGEEKKKDPR